MLLPFEIKNQVIGAFCSQDLPAYGQVATVDEHDHPQVRTVHCHYIKEQNSMAFNAHVESNKWKDLVHNLSVSGCYFDMVQMIQFRWEGPAQLIQNNNEILQTLWLSSREEVRLAYWLSEKKISLREYKKYERIRLPRSGSPLLPTAKGGDDIGNNDSNIDLSLRSSGHGVVMCSPIKWKIYEVNPEHYCEGKITEYSFSNNAWFQKESSILGI
ncbi:MAG: pyridoxamine 5'-phosphate oxidase family protein [Deltaproteobacteria bacterium]|nr:pyridoxamine 5'-phosphate oxidase family protein [Deltaproteobacteria bacterium]